MTSVWNRQNSLLKTSFEIIRLPPIVTGHVDKGRIIISTCLDFMVALYESEVEPETTLILTASLRFIQMM